MPAISASQEHFIADEHVFLRLLTAEDVTPDYLAWFRDPIVTEYLDAKNLTQEDVERYIEGGHASGLHAMYGIFDVQTQNHIGNIKIGPINWAHGTAGLVTVIGDRNYWGKGIARSAIKTAIPIAFEHLGLRKLSDGVADGNQGSLKAYTAAGFVHEATMKGHHLIDGRAKDRLVISCFNPKFFPDKPAGA